MQDLNGRHITPQREVIILAGGLGTRLRSAIPDLPKSMAPVAGHPFLYYLINYLRMQGVQRIIFSLGYQSATIEDWLKKQFPTLDYDIAREESPLGTGGAIRLALEKTREENVLVTNGDTIFHVSIQGLYDQHHQKNSACTLALKPMKAFDRYGAVEIDREARISSFHEKKYFEQGLINGGLYLLNKKEFLQNSFPPVFSFEKDYLEKFYGEGKFFGFVQDGYFIDIGIPSDFQQAGIDLKAPQLDFDKIDKTWTLFLDRDGVINDERLGEYVLHWGQFIFSSGVLNVFKKLSDIFGRIIIVSNQRGVGKGLMSEEDLQSIHLEMQREVEIVQGKIDRIYYCTQKEDTCFDRKPNPGMAYKAIKDFPEIDPAKSIMVGNKPSDMRFGRSAGMFTVFVKTTNPHQVYPHPDIDLVYPTLYDFASDLKS